MYAAVWITPLRHFFCADRLSLIKKSVRNSWSSMIILRLMIAHAGVKAACENSSDWFIRQAAFIYKISSS